MSANPRTPTLRVNEDYVQRDVSTANLLIALSYRGIPLRCRFSDVRGCLIDFDHAKEVLPVAQRKAELELRDDPRLYTIFRNDLHPELAKRITKEVFQRALQLVKFRAPEADRSLLVACSAAYIEAALQYHEISGRSSLPNNPYTPEQLGWNSDLLHPAVNIHQDRDGRRSPRSGTPPYASAKILNEEPVQVFRWLASLRPSVVVHDAIHDMESFFWVLLHLCMTRAGPGGARREELVGKLDHDTALADVLELRRIVYCFFDGPLEVIAWNKKEAFKDCKNFELLVLRHIHPYFELFRSLLHRWWELLLLVYEFEGYEYHNNHAFVIELLERTLKELGTIASPDDEQRQEDVTERRVDYIPTQQASTLSGPNEYRVTTTFDTIPEAQRQKPVTDAQRPASPTAVYSRSGKD
ncbi:hypothetical protein BN946_scf184912.g32 [Trametes cinnabarina]|uniref:Fungal-type protein kinase domain-containing protein n=1 Tax=Pycnoporus cinnabarinus TaxID=5643 RepID=A0A060SYA4_PYCCI|nr:hypothetical protein BN946_scf184912.g32 [Trametes cinnabarina]